MLVSDTWDDVKIVFSNDTQVADDTAIGFEDDTVDDVIVEVEVVVAVAVVTGHKGHRDE